MSDAWINPFRGCVRSVEFRTQIQLAPVICNKHATYSHTYLIGLVVASCLQYRQKLEHASWCMRHLIEWVITFCHRYSFDSAFSTYVSDSCDRRKQKSYCFES